MRIQQKNFKMALNHSLIQDLKHKIIAKEFCKNFSHAKKQADLCSLDSNTANSIQEDTLENVSQRMLFLLYWYEWRLK